MTSAHVARRASLLLAIFAGSQDAAAQCVRVIDDKAAPSVKAPEVDVRQIIQLAATHRGSAAEQRLNYLYVEITREEEGTRESRTFVRMLAGTNRAAPFTFSRDGKHSLTVYGAETSPWPKPPDFQTMTRVCGPQEVAVHPPLRREDFPGVRPQWWGAYRIPTRVELGGALFLRRLGLAAAAQLDTVRAIRDRVEPPDTNPLIGVFELRYRGARGHIGGGVRYYPDDEPDRDRWRPTFSLAEELPSFKGRPIWLLADVWLDDRRKNVLKGLGCSFGVRFDLWGSRP